MDYFRRFPITFYSIDNKATMTEATNILVRFGFFSEVIKNRSNYYPVVIQDGDRPDTIADKYYGDSKYAWLVNTFNNYIDPLWEWPLSDREFNKYIEREYGSVSQALATIKYYKKIINGREYIVDQNQAYDTTIDAYTFEEEINENRRNIKLLDKRLLVQVKQELKEVFANV